MKKTKDTNITRAINKDNMDRAVICKIKFVSGSTINKCISTYRRIHRQKL